MVPNGWTQGKVKDLIKSLDAGVSVNSDDDGNLDAEFKILKTSCVSGSSFDFTKVKSVIIQSEIDRLKEPVLADSIIVSRMNTPALVGANGYVEKEITNTYLPDRLWQLKPYKGKVSMRWLGYWFASSPTRHQLSATATGTSGSMKNITKTDVLNININIPPLPEQQKIAKILTTWDKAINTTERLIENSKQQKKALMQQLLTGQKRLLDDSGRRFSGDWVEKTLIDAGVLVTDGDRGKEYPNSSELHNEGYCLFLSAKNVTKRGFVFDETQFITKEKHEKLRKGVVNKGDIVLTTRGTVGQTAYYDDTVHYECMRINSGMVTLNCEKSELDSKFFYALTNSILFKKQIDSLTFGSAQPQLTIKIIKLIKVQIPSIEEQKKIAEVLTTAEREIEVLEQQLADLQQEKKGLMQQLLTGKKRVLVDV